MIVVLGVTTILGAGGVGFKLVRSVQQDRLIEEARVRGMDAYASGDMQATLDELKLFVAREKDDVEVLMAFADARLQIPLDQGANIFESLGYYKRALQLLDSDPSQERSVERRDQALRHLISLYGTVGMRFEQIHAASRILDDEPNDVEALAARAKANYIEREFDESLTDVEALSVLEPRSLTWRSLHMEILSRQGHSVTEQLTVTDEWIDDHPDDATFLVIKAMLLGTAGRMNEAREVMGRAAVQGADSLEMLQAMVATLDALQMRDVAREAIETSQSRFPSEQWVRVAIIHRYWQSGFLAEALREIENAEADFSTLDSELLRLKVLLLAANDRRSEAEQALVQLRRGATEYEREAVDAWADALVARMGLNDANWKSAMQAIEHAISIKPTDPTLHMARGEVCAAVAEYTPAAESFKKALQLDPNWVGAGLAHVRVLLKLGRADEAFGTARHILQRSERGYLPPYLSFARASLAVMESGGDPRLAEAISGHSDDVIHLFETIHRKVPEQPAVASLLAEAYARTDRRERAVQFIGGMLEAHHSSGAALRALARVSQRHRFGMTEDLLRAAADIDGMTVPIALALADLYANQDDAARGLSVIDEAMALDPAVAQTLPAQQSRLAYLARTNDPTASAELAIFIKRFKGSGTAQSYVLSMSEVWDDEVILEEVIDNLESLLGSRSLRVNLARAQYLVRYHADDEPKLAEAVMMLSDVLKSSPDSVAALTFMAEASLLGAHPSTSRSIEHLERAINLVPGQLELYPKLITLLQDEGEFETAARYLKQLGELSQRDRQIQHTELQLLQRQGDFEHALVRATTLLKDSDRATDKLVLASMHRRTGDYDAAERLYSELTSTTAVSTLVMAEAASFYAETGRFTRGLRLLVDLKSTDEQFNRALIIGRYHAHHGTSDDAEKWLLTAVEEAPRSAPAREAMAQFYLREKNHVAAREQALIGIKLDPGNRGLRGTLALSNLDADPTGRAVAIQTLREMSGGEDGLLRLLELLERTPIGRPDAPISKQMLADSVELLEDAGTLLAAWNLAVMLHVRADLHDDAIELARRAVGRLPAHPEPARWATELLIESGSWHEALTEAQEWRRRSLQDTMPVDVVIARILLEQDRPRDAMDQLSDHAQRIVVQSERHPERLAVWLHALTASGRRSQAMTTAVPLLEADALWRNRWISLSLAQSNKTASESLSVLTPAMLADGELIMLASAWAELARRTDRREQFELADQYGAEAMTNPSTRVEALMLRGRIAEHRSDLGTAEQRYRQVLQEQDDHVEALNNLAFVLASHGRPTQALPFAERAIEHTGEHADVLDTYGNILRQLNRIAEAEEILNKARDLRPQDPVIMLSLAELFLASGRYDQAGRQLQNADRIIHSRRYPHRDQVRRHDDLSRKLDQFTAAAAMDEALAP